MMASHYSVSRASFVGMARPIRHDPARAAFVAFAKARKTSMLQWAKAAGVKPNSIYNWLAGRANELSIQSLRRLAAAADTTIETLLGGHPPPRAPDLHAVPLISTVIAGAWKETADPYEPGDGATMIGVDRPVGRNAFALLIEGTSMEPDFREGDSIIVDPSVQPLPGDFVVAKLAVDDKATFKRYAVKRVETKARRRSEVVELVPLNALHPTLTFEREGDHIVGVVVEHHRYLRR